MADGGQQHAGEKGRMSEEEAALQQQRKANIERLRSALDRGGDREKGRDDDAAVALIQELGLEQLTPLNPEG